MKRKKLDKLCKINSELRALESQKKYVEDGLLRNVTHRMKESGKIEGMFTLQVLEDDRWVWANVQVEGFVLLSVLENIVEQLDSQIKYKTAQILTS